MAEDPAPQKPPTIFVSFNRQDRAWADWIAWQVEDLGFSAAYQPWDFRPGHNIVLQMHQAATSDRTIAVLSPAYLEAQFTRQEMAAALWQDPTGADRRLIPVRVAPCKPEGLLGPVAYLDLIGLTAAEARRLLNHALSSARPKPTSAPPFPGGSSTPAAAPAFPGPHATTVLWGLPRRNPLFTGRTDVLQQLAGELKAHPFAALQGMPGMGKTQTAVEFAHAHRNDYQLILWANADTTETLTSALASWAEPLALPEKDLKEQPLIVNAVRRRLAEYPGCLLILDNADDLLPIRHLIPSTPGDLLFTTRDRAVAALGARIVPVRKLSEPDGARLFLRRAALLRDDAPLEQVPAEDRDAALELSRAMDGLPLALDQAGAFCLENQVTPAVYRDLYREEGKSLRARRGDLGEHESVTITFTLALAKLEAANPAAAEILRLAAFLAPEPIPESILSDGALDLGEQIGPVASQPLGLTEALGAAARLSLLEREPDGRGIVIHRLLQEVIRDELDEEARRTWKERAIRATNRAFPSVEYANWADCERLLPHALACFAMSDTSESGSPEIARLLNEAALYLKGRARYSEAEPLHRRTLETLERTLGPDHPNTASSLSNVAALLHDQGRLDDAEPLLRSALQIYERALGTEHPDTAIILNNLATLLRAQGRLDDAEPLHRRALLIREHALGPEHPNTANSLNNLATLLHAQGRPDDAEPLHRRALEITEHALGPEHPDTASSLSDLAVLLHDQGRLDNAEPLHRRALLIREQALGPDHPDTASSLNNLAALLRAQGRLDDAEPLHRRALLIREQSLGPEHPDTALSLSNLAALLRAQGRLDDAEPLHRRALLIREQALGPDHPDTANSLNNLAALLHDQGRRDDAERLYRRALKTCERTLGPEHPNVAVLIENLSALLSQTNREQEASQLLERAEAIRTKHARRNPLQSNE